ncbi:MAG: DUF3108 domain-containing protein [Thiobacillaceae bacterium]
MKTRPGWRVFLGGLVVSVLLHVTLLSRGWITLPAWIDTSDDTPIEARLTLPPQPAAVIKSLPPARVKSAAVRPAQPRPMVPALPAAASETPVTEIPAAPPESVPDVVSDAAVAAAPPEPPLAAAEIASPLNRLPRRLTLEYRARYGLASGKQTLLWVNEGERYTITSVAAASGLASLVFSGQLVQTSHGRIGVAGLQPESFWDQRGNKRSQSRFDYDAHMILTESNKGSRSTPLPDRTQDVQSLLFQIALTAPPPTDSQNAVFNGKTLRVYRYHMLGEVLLDTPLGKLRTVHMVRVTDHNTDRFEVWLALDRHYLPVKLSTEISGYDAELVVQRITSED